MPPNTNTEKSNSKLKLYKWWVCPFAQRAWIACEEKGIEYDLLEIDPRDKTEEWLAINPKGQVPAIIHDGKLINESGICVEYIDDYYPERTSLMPTSAYAKAYARMWGNFVDSKLVSPFYSIMKNPDEDEKRRLMDILLSSIETFSREIKGPYFMGEQFGFVDVLFIPFAHRYHNVLKAYRNFTIPQDARHAAFHRWYNECMKRKSVASTSGEDAKITDLYLQAYCNPKPEDK